MNLNIDQLDAEERKKISALLRERQDVNRDKGVEYIFRRPDEREDFLLGKKVDLNKMAKEDKSMMGESEVEFKERMEKRKIMQMVLEDPMSIVQFKEQQARKVALEKRLVHQRLAKKYQSKFQRNRSVSSSNSDSSDCTAKLGQLLSVNNLDDDNILGSILSHVKSNDDSQISKLNNKHKYKNKSKYSSRSPSNNIKKREESPSRDYRRNYSLKSSKEDNKYLYKRKHRSRSRSHDYKSRNKHRSRSNNEKLKNVSRHDRKYIDQSKQKYNQKSKLTKEEKEKRLEEMRENAKEWNTTIDILDTKFKKQDHEQAVRVEENLKRGDEYVFNQMVKLNKKKEYSVQNSISQRNKQNKIDKMFKR